MNSLTTGETPMIDKVKNAVFKRPKNWKTNEISMIEIRKHNTVDDVWIITKNKVYNATPFIKIHPGGYKSIMRCAGGIKDCEVDFNFHSTNGRKIWQKYQIGIIEGKKSQRINCFALCC